jgi:hypothetical protein
LKRRKKERGKKEKIFCFALHLHPFLIFLLSFLLFFVFPFFVSFFFPLSQRDAVSWQPYETLSDLGVATAPPARAADVSSADPCPAVLLGHVSKTNNKQQKK